MFVLIFARCVKIIKNNDKKSSPDSMVITTLLHNFRFKNNLYHACFLCRIKFILVCSSNTSHSGDIVYINYFNYCRG